MNSDFAVIFVGATQRQNIYWWPSFEVCNPGLSFDLIYVHRDFNNAVQDFPTHSMGRVYFENKIFRRSAKLAKKRHSLTGDLLDHFNKDELPNKAFGAYEYYFNKYKNKYKYFAFVSDDVYLRRNNWLKEVYDLFEKHSSLGFISPMLSNNPRHIRAPIWFGKTECLKKIDFSFKSDHIGEMEIADRCVSAGYFGIQIGHKCDFAYDPDWMYIDSQRFCGTPFPTKFFEDYHFGPTHYNKVFSEDEIKSLDIYQDKLFSGDFSQELTDSSLSSSEKYQRWNIALEVQPYHGLIYNPCIPLVKSKGYGIRVFENLVLSGPLDIDRGVYFGQSYKGHLCMGISPSNPIAILEL